MKRVVYIATVILSVVYIFIGNKIATGNLTPFEGASDQQVYKARVIKIVDIEYEEYKLDEDHTVYDKTIIFTAKILNSDKKNEIIQAAQPGESSYTVNFKEVEPGDKILIQQNHTDNGWIFADYLRSDLLIILTLVFFGFLILFGRTKGINTIISLVFTCLAIMIVFIPAVLSGLNIYFWSIITCVFIIFMTLLLVSGPNEKSLSAAMGCFSATLTCGLLTVIMDKALKLTGIVDEDSLYLTYLREESYINLNAIIFASIIIGALGAVMDVAMSISSSLNEIKDKAGNISFNSLYKSGISIGRDVMGTMANTLILAYIGSSLSLTLLLVAYNSSLLSLMNRELIVVEILQALAGSFGILLTIPLTSLISAFLYCRNKGKNKEAPKPEELQGKL